MGFHFGKGSRQFVGKTKTVNSTVLWAKLGSNETAFFSFFLSSLKVKLTRIAGYYVLNKQTR